MNTTSRAPQVIAVLDVGKTHARLLLIDSASGAMHWSSRGGSGSRAGPHLRELDLAHIEAWLLGALAEAATHARIDAIVPVAHGAAAVLLDANEQVVAAPDYEAAEFDEVAESYRTLRDDFNSTLSPFLAVGLNLGRQWHWLQQRQPTLAGRVTQALLYPQYWAWRLCGVAASEVTSLGCHTDLWRPIARRYSLLAIARRWSDWLPAVRGAHEVLGTIRPELAARTGLPAGCRVLCGIHDSNASYLCHLAAHRADESFAVISSGTWTVIMARGASLERLREGDDMLANVDAHGTPVATARFMGGREFAAIAGDVAGTSAPSWADIERLLAAGIQALPSFAPAGGPFAGRKGRIVAPRALSAAESTALATLYLALMCDRQLDALGAQGAVVIDGPLATNALFAPLLAALRPGQKVALASGQAGAAQAARLLCGQAPDAPGPAVVAAPVSGAALRDYRHQWRRHAAAAK